MIHCEILVVGVQIACGNMIKGRQVDSKQKHALSNPRAFSLFPSLWPITSPSCVHRRREASEMALLHATVVLVLGCVAGIVGKDFVGDFIGLLPGIDCIEARTGRKGEHSRCGKSRNGHRRCAQPCEHTSTGSVEMCRR